ncbi:4Fe-4S double cluster binding domain-containing protein [Clostridium sp. C8-1-8]|uniref:4Fe-4S double cluster binding domain-containing protein n=1 Tax=Clostridium sp. C8-1-8 TaxID=2698831 RepID=UPI00136C8101|nr:4Fe-4S double cluster binding domain-containing protein [Clostridium sp. C8-1-8]
MKGTLERIAIENGDRLKIIPSIHLKDLEDILNDFKAKEALNDFQNWIVNELYQLDIPKQPFQVNSIILAAIPHPFYAKVKFTKEGVDKTFLSLVCSDFNKTEAYIKEYAEENHFSIVEAKILPFKRLAVHSGLAYYGRNNITYINGLGSNFSYKVYFTDLLCEEDTWGELKNAKACTNCSLCINNCPTGAIRKDRFLIDNTKCLSFFNEAPGEFPAWIPVQSHHTLYDCLKCQIICPMNQAQRNKIIENISFTEEETNLLLEGYPLDNLSTELKYKIDLLGINQWYNAIPRNLKTLLDL